jgi:hypothetical protein
MAETIKFESFNRLSEAILYCLQRFSDNVRNVQRYELLFRGKCEDRWLLSDGTKCESKFLIAWKHHMSIGIWSLLVVKKELSTGEVRYDVEST